MDDDDVRRSRKRAKVVYIDKRRGNFDHGEYRARRIKKTNAGRDFNQKINREGSEGDDMD